VRTITSAESPGERTPASVVTSSAFNSGVSDVADDIESWFL
jgi:hypothetical protein